MIVLAGVEAINLDEIASMKLLGELPKVVDPAQPPPVTLHVWLVGGREHRFHGDRALTLWNIFTRNAIDLDPFAAPVSAGSAPLEAPSTGSSPAIVPASFAAPVSATA